MLLLLLIAEDKSYKDRLCYWSALVIHLVIMLGASHIVCSDFTMQQAGLHGMVSSNSCGLYEVQAAEVQAAS